MVILIHSSQDFLSQLDNTSFWKELDRHSRDERRLHIDAAVAQLLTLRRLEIERERKNPGYVRFIDDEHVKAASGADIGGWGMPKNPRNDSARS